MAVYERAEGAEPELLRFPEAAHADDDFLDATNRRGRIFNVHVRRATMGHLALENTHPFCLGSNTLGHNGTILRYPRLLEPDMRRPDGDTDSEHLFNLLMHNFDPGDPVGSIRRDDADGRRALAFSGLNILFSDGERLFAYRLGLFELHWLARPGQLLVASEQVTDEPGWHSVQQDVLLTLDPKDLEEPHAERLLGDELVGRAQIQKVDLEPAPARSRARRRGGRAGARSSGGRGVSTEDPREEPLRRSGEPSLRAAREPRVRWGPRA